MVSSIDSTSILQNLLPEIGQVIVLEATKGQCRYNYLQQIIEKAHDSGTKAWLLNCDKTMEGPWAGLKDLLTDILPQVQVQAPDLIVKHDYELTRVLPALRHLISVRYPSLTDMAVEKEQIRNYPADRAFRIIHGVIDFLTAWFERCQTPSLIIAGDNYELSGGLVRIFFAELMRRSAQKLNLRLIVTVPNIMGNKINLPDIIGKFNQDDLKHIHLNLPSKNNLDISVQSVQDIANIAAEIEENLKDDPIEQEIYLPRLIQFLLKSNQHLKALDYQIKAATIYNRKGFYEDGLSFALDALEQLKRYCPLDIDKHWLIDSMLYTSYVALDKPLEAFEVMEQAMNRTNNPEHLFKGCFMMAMLYIRELEEKDITKAESYLEQGLQELTRCHLSSELKLFQTTFNRNGLALIRYRQGRHQEAIELCQWCYEQVNTFIKPEQHLLYRSVLLFNIAQVYDFTGNYTEAINYFNAAIKIDSNYSEYYNYRGNLYFKMGQKENAISDYFKAIELSPPYPEVWANVGQCYRHLGEFQKAVDAYSNALDLQPNQFSVLVARAQVLEMLDEVNKSLADYNAALKIDSNQPLVLANRAVLHYEAGRYQDALNDLNQAIAISPETADLYQNRAIAFTALERHSEAKEDWETYLQKSISTQ
ncbi:MAG: tetratricopeptide repeat protein [Nostoc sp. TH1S01]|nr:tetratricopeptide repeat protein [Nostoc sp. TH1S01]